MEHTAAREDEHVRELNEQQAWELFDEAAHFYLGTSGQEFLDLWEAGHFEDPDQPEVMSVVMLMPFVQSEEPL
jgi:hypothetical protein